MSRCKACDVKLNDKELSAKDKSGSFIDMCVKCRDQSYLYTDAEYTAGGYLVKLNNPPESDFKWDYVGGMAAGESNLDGHSEITKMALNGEILNEGVDKWEI